MSLMESLNMQVEVGVDGGLARRLLQREDRSPPSPHPPKTDHLLPIPASVPPLPSFFPSRARSWKISPFPWDDSLCLGHLPRSFSQRHSRRKERGLQSYMVACSLMESLLGPSAEGEGSHTLMKNRTQYSCIIKMYAVSLQDGPQ